MPRIYVKYEPARYPFLTHILMGGAMRSVLSSAAHDLVPACTVAIGAYGNLWKWNRGEYHVAGPEPTQSRLGDRAAYQVGVTGPFVVAAELGGPKTTATHALARAAGL